MICVMMIELLVLDTNFSEMTYFQNWTIFIPKYLVFFSDGFVKD